MTRSRRSQWGVDVIRSSDLRTRRRRHKTWPRGLDVRRNERCPPHDDRRPDHQGHDQRGGDRWNDPTTPNHYVLRRLLGIDLQLLANRIANPAPAEVIEVYRAHLRQQVGDLSDLPQMRATFLAGREVSLDDRPTRRVDFAARVGMKLGTGDMPRLFRRRQRALGAVTRSSYSSTRAAMLNSWHFERVGFPSTGTNPFQKRSGPILFWPRSVAISALWGRGESS